MSNTIHPLDGNYAQLAYAVVIQAVQDYENALCRLHRNPDNYNAQVMLADCDEFFKHDIGYYCDFDGEYIMNEIQKKVKENGYRKGRGKSKTIWRFGNDSP